MSWISTLHSFLGLDTLLICAWSLSNIKIHLGQTQLSLRNMYLILRSKYFHSIILLFTDCNIYPENTSVYLKFGLHPKGISHTSVQNPTYKFQKRNISSFQENVSSIQNYQGLSFLPVTFTGLADLFPQLGS